MSLNTPAKRKETREDVARAAGFSTTAVSYAFSGKGRLPESTRELVLQTAKQLGYEGNYYAQRLRSGNDDMVSLFSLQLISGVNTDKITAILFGLGERGYYAPFHSLSHSTESRQIELARTLRRQQPRALVAFSPGISAAAWEEIRRYHDEGASLLPSIANCRTNGIRCFLIAPTTCTARRSISWRWAIEISVSVSMAM